jgi:hypothetical protein
MLAPLDFRLDAAKEIILVKPEKRGSEEAMLARMRQTFLPHLRESLAPVPRRSSPDSDL